MVSSTPSQGTVRPDSEGVDGYRPGDVIGQKYQLVRMLGEGGMGAIWLAHNLPLDADVAIKVMRADASSPDAAGRLLTEARAAARLRHPSIVRIFDLGRTDRGEPFIVMEVLEGESLGSVLDRKLKLAEENAVQTLLPVIAGLVAAHEQGVIHRDVKPENIVLSVGEGGRLVPKLVDFGVVKFRDRSPFNPQADEIEGSPDYMSPEQARGSAGVDERADVWAMSVVLYEVLAGERPFSGGDAAAILDSIVRDAAPPLVDVDPQLSHIVMRGLAKNLGERWQSMRELGQSLARWALARGIDTDITGASIALSWLDREPRRPLSDAPPRQTLTSGPSLSGTANEDADLSSPRSGAGPEGPTDTPSAPGLASAPVWAPSPRPKSRRFPLVVGAAVVSAIAVSWLVARWKSEPALGGAIEPGPVAAAEPAPVQGPPSPAAPPGPAAAEPGAVAEGAAAPADLSACVARYFPPDTFASPPNVSALCDERDARLGARALHAEVVRGSSPGATTEGMRQWSQLGWHEMALYAAMRARCCSAPEPIWLPAPVGTCPSLAAALDALASAHARGEDLESPLGAIRRAVHCALKSGGDAHYVYHEAPQGSAEPLLRHALEQAALEQARPGSSSP